MLCCEWREELRRREVIINVGKAVTESGPRICAVKDEGMMLRGDGVKGGGG